ncbi:MAG: NAD(P)/FAD-dependent oxidoreductase [Candidatus Omnitrophica bacterium]|nr:NAD(P)/FAD-dependent oxidoreductase [Candidatus Omnitrophota bacterium]
MTDTDSCDVIIIGGGAAGLMCAITAGQRGRRVIVMEHTDRICRKVRISGGGRCNFTNIHTAADRYLSENPHFARSALARYTPEDFIRMVRSHGIAFHEKKLGQLFCDGTAQEIITLLRTECGRAGVRIITGCQLRELTNNGGFKLRTSQGTFTAQSLVVATGGLSVPSAGATDLGYRIARQFGIRVAACRPGLVPLTLAPADLSVFKPLSGVALPTTVRFNGTRFEESILFTHRGLSGPAVLQISSYWKPGQPLTIDLAPGQDLPAWLAANGARKTLLKNALAEILPARLAETLAQRYLTDKPMNRCTEKELRRAAELLAGFTLTPRGTEGYAKAEVTVGGVDTAELSSKTMETVKVPGLYFIGEVVDVTGHLGGYNFQWAWSSGHAAGRYA